MEPIGKASIPKQFDHSQKGFSLIMCKFEKLSCSWSRELVGCNSQKGPRSQSDLESLDTSFLFRFDSHSKVVA